MTKKKTSSKKTRNLERTRREILAVTFGEVFRHGFQGVSIDDIVKKTKLTKGALYHQFPTKLDLGYALVDEVIRPMILERWILPLESYENPVEGILKQMQKLIGDLPPEQLILGCPLNNLVQEMSPLDAGFKKRLAECLNLWVDETERHLKRAKKAGLLRADVNTKEVATFVVMAHEGFFGLIKGMNQPGLFKTMFHSLKEYLEGLAA